MVAINYLDITTEDVMNGPGFRVTLWVAGCSHHCKGCHNPETWQDTAGKPFNDDTATSIITELKKSFYSGLTLSGGDPLFAGNLDDIYKLVERVRKEAPYKDIWIYTGYTYEDIMDSDDKEMKKRQKILSLCDVLVDGPFILKQRDITLPWRGSKNQRVIDIQSSIKNNHVVIADE